MTESYTELQQIAASNVEAFTAGLYEAQRLADFHLKSTGNITEADVSEDYNVFNVATNRLAISKKFEHSTEEDLIVAGIGIRTALDEAVRRH